MPTDGKLSDFFSGHGALNSGQSFATNGKTSKMFVRFCLNPPLAWIGTKNVPRFISADGLRIAHAEWRPFVVSLSKDHYNKGAVTNKKDFAMSQPGVKALFTALSSFYDFLTQEELTERISFGVSSMPSCTRQPTRKQKASIRK